MTAPVTISPATPGYDAQMVTLIGAQPRRLATFNDRVRYEVRRLNEADARTTIADGGAR